MKTKTALFFKRIRNKHFWKRGSGELLGFVCIMPIVLLMLCAMISAAHIGTVNQQLNYTAYNSCRSAVVSESMSIAETRAQQIYDQTMGTSNSAQYVYDSCTIELLDGASWEKGAYIRCTVRYYVDTLMPFTSGIREQSIVMMIENGDVTP